MLSLPNDTRPSNNREVDRGMDPGYPNSMGGAGAEGGSPRKANLSTTHDQDTSESESDDSDNSQEEALVRLLRSYKASRNAS